MIKVKNMVLSIVFILFSSCMDSKNTPKSGAQETKDTLRRPASVSPKATLLNWGSNEEPVMAWVEYVGYLKKNGKVYPHIIGVKYYFTSGITEIDYYENMRIRLGEKKIDFEKYSILGFSFSGNIKISNEKDSLYLFQVLPIDKSNEEYKGIQTISHQL